MVVECLVEWKGGKDFERDVVNFGGESGEGGVVRAVDFGGVGEGVEFDEGLDDAGLGVPLRDGVGGGDGVRRELGKDLLFGVGGVGGEEEVGLWIALEFEVHFMDEEV